MLVAKQERPLYWAEELNCTEEDSQMQRQVATEAVKSLSFKDLKQKLNNSQKYST